MFYSLLCCLLFIPLPTPMAVRSSLTADTSSYQRDSSQLSKLHTLLGVHPSLQLAEVSSLYPADRAANGSHYISIRSVLRTPLAAL
jgi:hypothetical protein